MRIIKDKYKHPTKIIIIVRHWQIHTLDIMAIHSEILFVINFAVSQSGKVSIGQPNYVVWNGQEVWWSAHGLGQMDIAVLLVSDWLIEGFGRRFNSRRVHIYIQTIYEFTVRMQRDSRQKVVC